MAVRKGGPTARGPMGAGRPQRARTAAYGRGAGRTERDVARARVPARSDATQFRVV
jgi:hypothetical protein